MREGILKHGNYARGMFGQVDACGDIDSKESLSVAQGGAGGGISVHANIHVC